MGHPDHRRHPKEFAGSAPVDDRGQIKSCYGDLMTELGGVREHRREDRQNIIKELTN